MSGTKDTGTQVRTCGPRVGEDDGSSDTDSTAQAHDGRESALAHKRGRHALPVQHQTGADGTNAGAVEPVRGAGVAKDARKLSWELDSACAPRAGEGSGR